MSEKRNKIDDEEPWGYLADLFKEGFKLAASDGSCPKCRSTLYKEIDRKTFNKTTTSKKYYLDDYYDEVFVDSNEVVLKICENCNQQYFKVNFSHSNPISSFMRLHINEE